MLFLFARHGETSINVQKHLHGIHDPAQLTEKGREQALRLAAIAKRLGILQVCSSTEKRSMETAEIVANALRIRHVIPLASFAERNWGTWSYNDWPEIQAKLEVMDLETRYTFRPSGGESWQDMESRIGEGLAELTGYEQNTAVITHGGILRALIPILKGEPKESSFAYDFENAGIAVFKYANGEFTEIEINEGSLS